MPFTEKIVKHINDSLKACSLFTDGKFHEIATIIARKKTQAAPLETLPGILEGKDYKTIEPNDKFGLIVYHKVISNQYSYDKQGSFGDGFRNKSVTEMSMIVWADLLKLKSDVEPVIIHSMPQGLSTALKQELSLISCLITPTGSTMDRLMVFRQEYPQSDFFLKPNHQFFSIRYRIETSFDKRCIDKCLCGSD